MMRAVAITLAFSLSACAATQQAAVERSKQELARRGFALPHDYHVDVAETFELIGYTYRGDLYQFYVVSYTAHGKPLYRVTVQRYTGQIREFEDLRSAIAPRDKHT